MPIRRVRPTSNGTRQITFLDNTDLTQGQGARERASSRACAELGRPQQPRPRDHRATAAAAPSSATAIIDWKRDKDGVPAKVAAIEYDPNRNAASPCSTTRTATSATSSRRSASRSATR